jgi:hypothetical protein
MPVMKDAANGVRNWKNMKNMNIRTWNQYSIIAKGITVNTLTPMLSVFR